MRLDLRRIGLNALVLSGGALLLTVGALSWLQPTYARTSGRVATGGEAPPEPVRYSRDIRPILADRCFDCHGPDEQARVSGLRLDQPEGAFAERDGIIPIVPGDVEGSELWQRITTDDPSLRMPPAESKKRPLSADERERIRRWIAQGAEYEPHWAFVPPTRPALPEVAELAGVRNPVDRFINDRLQQHGIVPSPIAGDETLCRRVFFDLTGLPPTPEELSLWLDDTKPQRLERLINTLMTAEPYLLRYAERMTVPWLDAARYADTCGIHMDAGRQMWLWRDWVLESFRDNMPYDRFVTEQIAGDLMPNATISQQIASGFNRNHVTTDEGGAINEEYLVEYAVDRANTTGSVMLGMTFACARCHDHKYDPISQENYYSFYAFFNSNDEPGLYSQTPEPNRAHEPFIEVPTVEQTAELDGLEHEKKRLASEIDESSPEEVTAREAFLRDLPGRIGLQWQVVVVQKTESSNGATLELQNDGSVLGSGDNPDTDEHHIIGRVDGNNLRLLLLEAMTDESLPNQRVGRAPNGNAVLTGIQVEAVSVANPQQNQALRFTWAWADVEQADGDYLVVNILDSNDKLGWAVDGHNQPGGRVAMLLTEEPFGFDGGTELHVRLRYASPHHKHVLGRVRLHAGSVSDAKLHELPLATSGWYIVGPIGVPDEETGYAKVFGPEQVAGFELDTPIQPVGRSWQFNGGLADDRVNQLSKGIDVTYVGRRIFSPAARTFDVSLGSDDGFALFVNGREVVSKKVVRGIEPDQDQASIPLRTGENLVVLKIINAGGFGAFYYSARPDAGEMAPMLVAALVPPEARSHEVNRQMHEAWKRAHFPEYGEKVRRIAEIDKRLEAIGRQVPRTMIMKELPEPRETFVLTRGVYDRPDRNRPVKREVPKVLGELPENAPANRFGLSQWLTAEDNPLVARVMVNRLWEMLFGSGIVRTSEDFGLQGEWPSHPELLDWLAVEFRESGWDVQHMLRLIMTSRTYQQQSVIRRDVLEIDPDNRLLAWYPRRRLEAEFIRDQALYVSGLLVEKLGGPSVKPYQPPDLWKEVAMIQSNTRIFQRGEGEDLWRRSLYTYWKRACPPPSLLIFDAPTRESCTIRRSRTNTPLQALVLMNDEQFVEAARALAQRTCGGSRSDEEKLATMFMRCTGRHPDEVELSELCDALNAFRTRYRESPDDATALLIVGEAPLADDMETGELAAWTMVANAILNMSETITQD